MNSDDRTTVTMLRLRAYVLRALGFAGVWWTLTEGDGGWGFGLVLALIVAALSLIHMPPARHLPRIQRVPGFLAYFLLQSLRAGWDVARRTLRPELPLQPGLLRLPMRLPTGAPTWWMMIVISLLPGTLSVQLQDAVLELHCLALGDDVVADVREAEDRLARLFGLTLDDAIDPARVHR
jgi:multicomponent Na+:H+ antiporter subunit E